MTSRLLAPFAFGLACLTGQAAAAPVCTAQSAAHRVALAELYTSEGCDSCPPADAWLAGLAGRGLGPDRVVPVALHVDYWDYLGWRDPFADPRHARRQRERAAATGGIVYTPQVNLAGREFRKWGSAVALEPALAMINTLPAPVRFAVEASAAASGVSVRLQPQDAAAVPGPLVVHIVLVQDRLESSVLRGENRGRRLAHARVARAWSGPLDFTVGVPVRATLPRPSGAGDRDLGIVAFVERVGSGEVLQVLHLPLC